MSDNRLATKKDVEELAKLLMDRVKELEAKLKDARKPKVFKPGM